MLIREEQMHAFDVDQRSRFHERLSSLFRKHLTKQTENVSDQAMLVRIADADRRAKSYGIVNEQGVAQFAALTFIAGPKFDERPKTRKYLTYPKIEPHHKIDTLFDCIVEHDAGRRKVSG